MSKITELGWQPVYDEGLRLMTDVDNLKGIQARLYLPSKYASPSKYSYFNFYLGINYASGGAVEAGLSYGARDGAPRWRAFVNPGESKELGGVDSQHLLTLYLDEGANPVLEIKGLATLSGKVDGGPGKVKMVMAIHENTGDKAKRKVWFNRTAWENLKVWDGKSDGKGVAAARRWRTWQEITGLGWHLQRPPSFHDLIKSAGQTGGAFTAWMVEPK